MSLATIQEIFWRHLRGDDSPLTPFTGTAELSAGDRVGIYARMVLHRQIEALRATFPKVAAALDEDEFHAIAERYVRLLPSDDPDLGQIGRGFPGALGRADLRDLARLEWARDDVFSERPCEPLSAAELGRLAQDASAFMALRVRLVAAVRLLDLDHDLGPLWDETVSSAAAAVSHVVVWRAGFDVFHAPVGEDEWRALERARDGAALGDVCGVFEDPGRAAQVLESWLGEGFLTPG